MNKNLKNSLFAALLFTVIVPQTTQPVFPTLGDFANAVFNSSWSSTDILNWSKNGYNEIFERYQDCSLCSDPITLTNIRTFGLRNTDTSFNFFDDRAYVITENNRLLPLHNAHLLIQKDSKELVWNFQLHLNQNCPAFSSEKAGVDLLNQQIDALAKRLAQISEIIETSLEYQEEEKLLQEKIDRRVEECSRRQMNNLENIEINF